MRTLLPLLLLTACPGDESLQTCDEIAVPDPVGACFGGDDVVWEGYGTVAGRVDGTVTAVSEGEPPEACEVALGRLDRDEDVVVIEVDDAEGLTTIVGLQIPDLDAPVAAGDTVSLDFEFVYGEFGPDLGWVTVEKDGAPVVIVSEGATADELTLPDDVTVGEGARRCTTDDGCGVYGKYDLLVGVGDDTAPLPYGEDVALGGWRFVHGSYEQQDEGLTNTCPDWFVADAVLGIVAKPE